MGNYESREFKSFFCLLSASVDYSTEEWYQDLTLTSLACSSSKKMTVSQQKSGVAVADECLKVYEDLKMKHQWLYIIYRLTDDLTKIVIEEKGGHDKTYDDFVFMLKEAEKKKQCRYGVFDVHFLQNDVQQERLAFFLWSPDSATTKQKMLYTTSKGYLRTKMNGIQAEIQCTDDTDLTMANILERLSSKYT